MKRIDKVGQLDELPMYSVIQDNEANVMQRWPGGLIAMLDRGVGGPRWAAMGTETLFDSADVKLPALLLTEGNERA